MAITSVSGIANGTALTGASTSTAGARVNSQQFMQLLTTQLKNQNPFEPVADTEFLAQLAQFSQLEETQAQRSDISDLASSLRAQSSLQGLGQATGLIGKEISYVNADGDEETGRVESVKFVQGTLVLGIDSRLVPLANLTSVRE